jgi:hypothetical protein
MLRLHQRGQNKRAESGSIWTVFDRAAQGFKSHSLSFFAAVPNGPSWKTAAPAGENVNDSNGSGFIWSRYVVGALPVLTCGLNFAARPDLLKRGHILDDGRVNRGIIVPGGERAASAGCGKNGAALFGPPARKSFYY